MNEEKWRELKELPVDDSVKRKIYATILAEPKLGRRFRWQEVVVMGAVMLLLLFFLTVPKSDRTAAPGQLEAYVYVGEDEKEFYAFPTVMYTGIKKVTDAELLQQIAQMPQQLKLVENDFSTELFEVDLFVREDGQQSRYKLSYDSVLNWDTGEVYEYTSQNEHLRWALREYGRQNHFIVFPIMMLLAIAVSSMYYRYKRVKRPNYPLWASIVPVIWVGVGLYVVLINFPDEPIFKPYIWLYTLLYGMIQHWTVQKVFTHPVHLRVEKLYVWIITLVLASTFTMF